MSTAVEAYITGLTAPEEYPTLEVALKALAEVALVEVWGPGYNATVEALSPAAAPGIQAVLDRDGRWTAPLPVSPGPRDAEIRITVPETAR